MVLPLVSSDRLRWVGETQVRLQAVVVPFHNPENRVLLYDNRFLCIWLAVVTLYMLYEIKCHTSMMSI